MKLNWNFQRDGEGGSLLHRCSLESSRNLPPPQTSTKRNSTFLLFVKIMQLEITLKLLESQSVLAHFKMKII